MEYAVLYYKRKQKGVVVNWDTKLKQLKKRHTVVSKTFYVNYLSSKLKILIICTIRLMLTAMCLSSRVFKLLYE